MIYKYDEVNKRVVNDGFNVADIYVNESTKWDHVIVNLDGEHGLCSNTKSIKYWIILDGNATVYCKKEKSPFFIIERDLFLYKV